MTDERTVLTCDACGACCVVQGKANHKVTLRGDDKGRLPEEAEDWVIDVTDYLRSVGCIIRKEKVEGLKTKENAEGLTVCVALEGIVGKDAKCSIHDVKPVSCADFELDFDGCNKFRRIASLPELDLEVPC